MRKVILSLVVMSLMVLLSVAAYAACDPENNDCTSADCNSIFMYLTDTWTSNPGYCQADYNYDFVATDATCDTMAYDGGYNIGSNYGRCAYVGGAYA